VARKRSSRALLEILHQDARRRQGPSLALPTWWKRAEGPAPLPPEEGPAPEPAAAEPPRPAAPPSEPARTLEPSSEEVCEVGGPVLSWRDGCLTIHLDAVMAVFVGGVLILLLAGAFLLGQHTAGPANPEATQQATSKSQETQSVLGVLGLQQGADQIQKQPAADQPVAARRPPARQVPAQQPPPDQRQPGRTYLVLQVFSSEARTAAEHARAFLSEHGLPTTLERMDTGQWSLVTAEGADAQTQEGARRLRELALQAKSIGDEYLKSGGRYRFHMPYQWTYPSKSSR
jgi:hypothetical protein